MQKTDELVNTLVKAVDDIQNKKAKGYDTQATVTRIEGGTAYVHIPGGVDETPAQMTITAKKGDTVRVRVANGTAWLVGNATAPPTDDATANAAVVVANTATTMAGDAIESANIAAEAAESAKTSATEAKADAIVANQAASNALRELSTVENVVDTLEWITAHGTMTLTSDVVIDPSHVYFVVDPTGQYVVGGTHYSIVEDPKTAELSTYYELTIDDAVTNYVATHLALTEEGLWLLPATTGTNKVLIATGAGSTYTTAGTYIINSTGGIEASFRSDGATIGEALNDHSRTEIGTDGMHIYQRVNGSDTIIAHLGYGEGTTGTGTANAPYYILGSLMDISSYPQYSASSTYYRGDYCTRNGDIYGCISEITTPEEWTSAHWQDLGPVEYKPGNYSFSEGMENRAMYYANHTEGRHNFARGAHAHAEGRGNFAGDGAHAEGISGDPGDTRLNNVASGRGSHAEGGKTIASGVCSHAEGYNTIASGAESHVSGYNTVAGYDYQTVIGKYNDNKSTNLFEVGNGTSEPWRSNAFEVTTSGNVNIPSGAKYKINGTNLAASDVGAVPTSRTVNSKALSSNITLSASDVGALASSSVADYITSKGTSGSWYYEKYASGKIEAVFHGSVTYGTMAASGQLYRSTNNAVAIPSGIFAATPQRTEITINNASTVVVCATAVASSSTNVNVQVWRSTNASSSIDATIRCTYTP